MSVPGRIDQDLRISDDATLPSGSWYLGMAAGLVPIVAVLALDPQGWFPFTVAKWWAVLVVALLVATVATAWGMHRDRALPPTLERMTVWLLAGLIALIGISTIGALDGLYAWVGTPIRHLGLLAWVVFALMFAVGRRVGTDEAARRAALYCALVAALLLGLYAVVELVFGAPVGFMSNSSRLGGPFGSAAYLGAACCLFLPVTIGAAADTGQTRGWRIVGALACVSVGVAVLGSGSRAALVGLAVAGIAVGLARRGQPRASAATSDRPGRPIRWIVAAGVVAMVAVAVAIRAGVFERSAGLGSRIDEWRVATRAVADHAVAGVGPEGYRLVVGQFVDADYVRRFGESTGIDRAHSGVLDVAVTSGIVAAAVYVALLGAVCWSAWRLARRSCAIDTGIAGSVIAYAVHQQLLFPLAELDPVFWLLAGIVVVRARPIARPVDHDAAAQMASVEPPTRRRRSVMTASAVLLGAAAVCAAVLGVLAVAADRLALDAAKARDVAVAIERAEAATNRAPYDIRHRLVLARSHERERSLGGVDRAIDAVEEALDISPLEVTSRYEHARLLSLRAAITGTDTDRLAASTAWEREIQRAPNCARCHLGAGGAASERGDIEAARTSLHIAADLGNDEALEVLDRIEEE